MNLGLLGSMFGGMHIAMLAPLIIGIGRKSMTIQFEGQRFEKHGGELRDRLEKKSKELEAEAQALRESEAQSKAAIERYGADMKVWNAAQKDLTNKLTNAVSTTARLTGMDNVDSFGTVVVAKKALEENQAARPPEPVKALVDPYRLDAAETMSKRCAVFARNLDVEARYALTLDELMYLGY